MVDFKKGLDLSGGVRIVLQADMSKVTDLDKQNAIEAAKGVIERRVNYLGVSEPYIVTTKSGNDYRIIVEIPGVTDVKSAVSIIGQTAQLQFRQLAPGVVWDESKFSEYYFNPTVWADSNVSGADLIGVDILFPQNEVSSSPQVQLKFSDAGRTKFGELAKQNINKPIALFFNDEQVPLAMPVVSSDLAEGIFGDPVISGNFDLETAQNLSLQIRAGALPVPVQILSQEAIGATLGESSVRASFFAGILAVFFILLFMVLLYGRLGLIADFALVLYSLIMLSLFKLIPVVLTLPGIAGFILSIGVAIDANILIFERVKEEFIKGKPQSVAIAEGFKRAWPSIKDSNVSSLLTAFILFYLGTGTIRGFAVTLAIGIIVSLFSALFVVRTLITIFKMDKDKRFMLKNIFNFKKKII